MPLAKELMGSGYSSGQAIAMGGQYSTINASGTTQDTGTPVKSSMCIVSGSDGVNGVTLPSAQVGDNIWLFNNSATALNVYPQLGSAICVSGTGLGVLNAAFTNFAYTAVNYKCFSPNQWMSLTST